jgi:hypothetical protein
MEGPVAQERMRLRGVQVGPKTLEFGQIPPGVLDGVDANLGT